jgi:hypothetical protein
MHDISTITFTSESAHVPSTKGVAQFTAQSGVQVSNSTSTVVEQLCRIKSIAVARQVDQHIYSCLPSHMMLHAS